MKRKSYDEIWREFRDKYTREGFTEAELRRIHSRWKWLGKTC